MENGNWNGVARTEYFADGAVKDLTFEEENRIETLCGTLIAKYTAEETRRKYISSVSFYENGAIKRVALEKQMMIQTPIGEYPAECVIFYPNGKLKRFFPLNGKLSGYWSMEDETALAEALQFHLAVGAFKIRIIGVSFYESGALKSFTLWPGEEIVINTNVGLFPVQIGFALYEDGSIKSLEPAYPIPIVTPIGNITVYDEHAIGIESDDNSLKFDPYGNIIGFSTSFCSIAVFYADGTKSAIAPSYAPSMTDDEAMIKILLTVSIVKDCVSISNGEIELTASLSEDKFVIRKEYDDKPEVQSNCSGSCSSCTHCEL
ncbi:MAG: hypothetical protein ACC608_04730 [Anaerofustis sp.]